MMTEKQSKHVAQRYKCIV